MPGMEPRTAAIAAGAGASRWRLLIVGGLLLPGRRRGSQG